MNRTQTRMDFNSSDCTCPSLDTFVQRSTLLTGTRARGKINIFPDTGKTLSIFHLSSAFYAERFHGLIIPLARLLFSTTNGTEIALNKWNNYSAVSKALDHPAERKCFVFVNEREDYLNVTAGNVAVQK